MPALQNLAKVAKFCQIWSNYAPARPADLAEYLLPWSLSSKTPSSSNQRHFIYLRFIRLIKFIISLLSARHNSVVVTFEWKKSAWPKRQTPDPFTSASKVKLFDVEKEYFCLLQFAWISLFYFTLSVSVSDEHKTECHTLHISNDIAYQKIVTKLKRKKYFFPIFRIRNKSRYFWYLLFLFLVKPNIF